MTSVLFDHEAEAALLGSILLNPRSLDQLLRQGLRPARFHHPNYSRVFEAIASLHEKDQPVDHVSTRIELERLGGVPGIPPGELAAFVAELPAAAPVAGNAAHYATVVLDLAEWRQRLEAADALARAAEVRDDEAWAQAEGSLQSVDPAGLGKAYDAEQWRDVLTDYFLEDTPVDVIPLPLPSWTDTLDGGLRRGELMVLAGWTSHGKSACADSMLDVAAEAGKRCHLYMTEMGALDRGLRYIARRTRLPLKALRRKILKPVEHTRINSALGRLPYGCTVIGDMTVADVCRDIRRARWDLAVVDHMHHFPYRDERELSAISGELMRCATASTTDPGGGTAIVAVAQLNESQMQGRTSPARPRPGLQSIKGASSIKQDADVVAFVWREDDEHGLPGLEGEAWIAKGRNSGLGGTRVEFNPRTLMFEEASLAMGAVA